VTRHASLALIVGAVILCAAYDSARIALRAEHPRWFLLAIGLHRLTAFALLILICHRICLLTRTVKAWFVILLLLLLGALMVGVLRLASQETVALITRMAVFSFDFLLLPLYRYLGLYQIGFAASVLIAVAIVVVVHVLNNQYVGKGWVYNHVDILMRRYLDREPDGWRYHTIRFTVDRLLAPRDPDSHFEEVLRDRMATHALTFDHLCLTKERLYCDKLPPLSNSLAGTGDQQNASRQLSLAYQENLARCLERRTTERGWFTRRCEAAYIHYRLWLVTEDLLWLSTNRNVFANQPASFRKNVTTRAFQTFVNSCALGCRVWDVLPRLLKELLGADSGAYRAEEVAKASIEELAALECLRHPGDSERLRVLLSKSPFSSSEAILLAWLAVAVWMDGWCRELQRGGGLAHEQYIERYYSILAGDSGIEPFFESKVNGRNDLTKMAGWLQRLCWRRLGLVWVTYSSAIEQVAGPGQGASFASRQALRFLRQSGVPEFGVGDSVRSVTNEKEIA